MRFQLHQPNSATPLMSRWIHTGLQTADVPDGLSNVPHAARGKLKGSLPHKAVG
ncbi:hypothetical protein K438DRAFT_1885368, partial [Mycena galopus ATCC 62051]